MTVVVAVRAIAGNNVHYVHISNEESNCTRVWPDDDVGGRGVGEFKFAIYNCVT